METVFVATVRNASDLLDILWFGRLQNMAPAGFTNPVEYVRATWPEYADASVSVSVDWNETEKAN